MSKAALPSYDEALARILPHAPPLGEEAVALTSARGRVLRREVAADRDQPPFDRAAMDGFAVRSVEIVAGKIFSIRGGTAAGAKPQTMIAGAVQRIATGAPLPAGADAVIQIEKSQVRGEEVSFEVQTCSPWMNVHRRASDARAGQVVIPAGTRLGPPHIGIAAAVGAGQLTVAQRPRITLLTSGDEVRPPETCADNLEPQQIRNSNGPMLRAFLEALGLELLAHVHIPDEPEQTLAAAREALSRSHLVVTVGGVSAGQRDFLPEAVQRLGLEQVVYGVAIQPGKPVLAMRDDCKLVLGLPGNPVSVWATAHLFLWPILQRMLHGRDVPLPWRRVTLAQAVNGSAGREVFRAARWNRCGQAEIITWHGSGDLMHTTSGEGFVRLPLADEAPAGTPVDYLPWIG